MLIKLFEYLGTKKLELEAVLLTHGHFDHIGAVNELVAKYQVPIYAHKKEKEYFENPDVNLSPMIYERLVLNKDFEYRFISDQEVIECLGHKSQSFPCSRTYDRKFMLLF